MSLYPFFIPLSISSFPYIVLEPSHFSLYLSFLIQSTFFVCNPLLLFSQITAAIAARTVDALSSALSAAAPFVATPALSKLVDRGNALKYGDWTFIVCCICII